MIAEEDKLPWQRRFTFGGCGILLIELGK